MSLKDKNNIFIKLSYYKNFLVGVSKIILSIMSMSLSLFISSFYNLGIGIAKRNSIKVSKKSLYNKYINVGIIVIVSSLIYVAYSIYRLIFGMNPNYHMYVGIGIAAVTFTDLTLAIIGIVKARKRQDMQSEVLKFIKLSTALISLSLTQTALLSFTIEGDISVYCAGGGILFGVFAGIVGIYMIRYIVKNKAKIVE